MTYQEELEKQLKDKESHLQVLIESLTLPKITRDTDMDVLYNQCYIWSDILGFRREADELKEKLEKLQAKEPIALTLTIDECYKQLSFDAQELSKDVVEILDLYTTKHVSDPYTWYFIKDSYWENFKKDLEAVHFTLNIEDNIDIQLAKMFKEM